MLASASCIIEKALLYARLLKYEKDFHLPDSKHMLHGKTGDRDTDPTAETKSEWLAAGFDQLDDICIQTDCTHGEDDEELAECLQRINTSADTPVEVAIVVITEAKNKVEMNIGKIFLNSTFFPSALELRVRINARTSVIGMIASVLVSLTVTALSSVAEPRA